MQFWKTRDDSIQFLEREHKEQVETLTEIVLLLDECIGAYEEASSGSTYARVCGLTALKAKNLGVGSYSLILDGLGQEAGALLRPFIEYTELLTYFRAYPEMVERAAENDLPKAGERAKAINGHYKEFRAHLNEHASHSSYSHFALSHLLTPETFQFKKVQVSVPVVLERNVRDLAVQLHLLLFEATLGLSHVNESKMLELGGRVDDLKDKVLRIFNLDAG